MTPETIIKGFKWVPDLVALICVVGRKVGEDPTVTKADVVKSVVGTLKSPNDPFFIPVPDLALETLVGELADVIWPNT